MADERGGPCKQVTWSGQVQLRNLPSLSDHAHPARAGNHMGPDTRVNYAKPASAGGCMRWLWQDRGYPRRPPTMWRRRLQGCMAQCLVTWLLTGASMYDTIQTDFNSYAVTVTKYTLVGSCRLVPCAVLVFLAVTGTNNIMLQGWTVIMGWRGRARRLASLHSRERWQSDGGV